MGLEQTLAFPCLGLLVSGGHTHIYRMEAPWRCLPLGRTLDDAAGEAFDKVGKLLGLAYPGGRLMDALARAGRADARLFPRPYLDNDNLDFSFSGLKTAAAAYIERYLDGSWPRPLHCVEDAPQALKDCCASFNLAVVDTVCVKVERALDRQPDLRTLIVAGGVAANTLLRERMAELMRRRDGKFLAPSPALCTDNAAMTAYAGWAGPVFIMICVWKPFHAAEWRPRICCVTPGSYSLKSADYLDTGTLEIYSLPVQAWSWLIAAPACTTRVAWPAALSRPLVRRK